ncbi:MAG: 23S rRNA (adenine(2503)-C(2))-methyltransferase RlmN [Verrucomicrobia bacterium]|nr:23S rRNA (adenine(2503)-C(2))-methyltransferase RlmN [Verrucomicrobiota bacterium]
MQPPDAGHRVPLYGLTRSELTELFQRWGLAQAHAGRLWNYLYLELAPTFDAMPELPDRVRARLAAETELLPLPVAQATDSSDGFTRKYLLTLADQKQIETVLMRFTGRVTACLSSQVGCAMGCVFCATGQMGYTRHLTPAEVVAQAVHVARALRSSASSQSQGVPSAGTRLRNVVLMGMGEPLHNYDAVLHAVDILRDPGGLALAGDRITLSTVGVVPGILRLAAERRSVNLAVSLHAATQPERMALVPVARTWPLDQLMAACRTYSEQTGRRIFYEWTLIEGQNDSPEQARTVGRLLRGMAAQVNLIPLNPTGGFAGIPTRPEAARIFQRILFEEFELPSTIRQRRGIDIAAGCGQLATADKSVES